MFRLRTAAAIGGLTAVLLAIATSSAAHPRRARAESSAVRECVVPGRHKTIDQLWHPDMSAAIAYAHSRVGDIAFAVRTADRFYGYRPDHAEWSASVVKAMLLVTYLDLPSVAGRACTWAARMRTRCITCLPR